MRVDRQLVRAHVVIFARSANALDMPFNPTKEKKV